MAGPDCGTCSSPSTFGRPRMVSNGPRKMYFKSQYAIWPPSQPRRQCSAPRVPTDCVCDHMTLTTCQHRTAGRADVVARLLLDGHDDRLITTCRSRVVG